MHRFLHDIRYAVRQLRRSPGFTLTVVLTLALGIGANTAIFTLVQSILLRSLPVSNPAQLYRIGDNDDCCVDGGFPGGASDTGDVTIFSYDLYKYLKVAAPEFQPLAAVQAGIWNWSIRRGNDQAKSIHGEFVTGNYFQALGTQPFAGRLFADSDDSVSAAPATVMSYKTWQGEYASDPSIVGSTIYIQTKPFTVIGIAPPGFFGDRVTDNPPDVWMPLHTEPYVRGDVAVLHHAEAHWLYLLGRVRPGTSVPALQARITAALRQWLMTRPILTANGGAALVPKMHVVLTPGGGGIQNLQQQTGKGLKLLMMLSLLVLLITCANIANLMLVRTTTRRSEIAVRVALGAGRRSIIRQILTESVLLSMVGGVIGLGVAYSGSRMILAFAFPDAHNLPISASPSLPVLGFAFLISLLTGVLFGLGPAWLSSHAQPAEALRGVNRSTRDRSALPQKTLVVVQTALSVVLLAGAILTTKSLLNLEKQNFGVATADRYVLHFDPAGAGYTNESFPALYREIEERFSALPGAAHLGLALYSPLEGDNWGECVIQQGHPAPRPGDNCGSTWDRVSAGFLDSVGVPIVQGRNFNQQDVTGAPQVVLVNEAFVKKFFPGRNPIGQHFGIDLVKYSGAFEIVGVFRDFKMNNPREEVHPVYLRPLNQEFTGYTEPEMKSTESGSMNVNAMILDFNSPQTNVDGLVRRTLAAINPNLTVMDLRSFGSQVAGNFDQERLVARLSMLFGALALLLASVGLYGVMSYLVAQRTSEIGLRMALGATRMKVVRLVLAGALVQLAIGLAIGIPAAWLAGRFMANQLYNVSASDPWALLSATAALSLCALLAGFLPARRAASIEPMQALRSE